MIWFDLIWSCKASTSLRVKCCGFAVDLRFPLTCCSAQIDAHGVVCTADRQQIEASGDSDLSDALASCPTHHDHEIVYSLYASGSSCRRSHPTQRTQGSVRFPRKWRELRDSQSPIYSDTTQLNWTSSSVELCRYKWGLKRSDKTSDCFLASRCMETLWPLIV